MSINRSAIIESKVRVNETQRNGSQTIPSNIIINERIALAGGTDPGEIDLVYYNRFTGIAAGVKTQFTLTGLLEDAYGNALDFAEVIFIQVINRSNTSPNSVFVGTNDTFGVHASGEGFWLDASDRCVAGPGAFIELYAPNGIPVTASTGDGLEVETNAGSANNAFDILILGRSA